MFAAALFTIDRIWRQPRCTLTDEWIKKMWYVDTMECYSAMKRMIQKMHRSANNAVYSNVDGPGDYQTK